ncbi:MAG: hypothetical protein ABW278_07400 [Steroidobacteraceae bacterium]
MTRTFGRFLELAIVTAAPLAAWSQLRQLGFADAITREVWSHAYGVAAMRGIAIGLHGSGDETFTLHFVRPEVAALHRELDASGIDIDQAQLGSDVFNAVALREPGGMLIRVLEAATFSTPVELPASAALGSFLTLSLPCADLDAARGFWEKLGLGSSDCDEPWDGLAIDGTPLTYHASAAFREPALCFRAGPEVHPASWQAAGVQSARPIASLRDRSHQLLRGPEGMAIVVMGSD